MIHYDDATKENVNEYNSNGPQIHDQLYRILIIGESGSLKIQMKQNLLLANVKTLTNPNPLPEYSNNMQDDNKNIEECNLGRKYIVLIV